MAKAQHNIATMMNTQSSVNGIPKIIWILWLQGTKDAPLLVKKCIESWRRKNPDWEINVLDQTNLDSFISIDVSDDILKELRLSVHSDIIRLKLLEQYGGVWTDATTYCIEPLNNWIVEHTPSGFFAFHEPGPDRLLANWFLASKSNSILISSWLKSYSSYLTSNQFKKYKSWQWRALKILYPLLSSKRSMTKYWFSLPVTKILKVHPYFANHYIFDQVIQRNSKCASIWNDTPKISAKLALAAHRTGVFQTMTDELAAQINDKSIKLHKLSWRYDMGLSKPGTILHHILDESKNSV